MTVLSAALLETHVADDGITPGRVLTGSARVILTSVDVGDITPRVINIAHPTQLTYQSVVETVSVHEQTHILPPVGMVATYSAPTVGSIMSLPFDLVVTHASDNAPVPSRVKNANGSVVKTHGDGSVPTPGVGRIVMPETLDYVVVAQAPHLQFAYIVPPGTYVQYHAAKVVVNTRLDVQPSKMESRFKAPKTDSWQPGLCNPPNVTVRYRASKIVINMDAVLTPTHASVSYSASTIIFGHVKIPETPVDIVCYFAAAQVDVDDGAQRHPLTVTTIRSDYAAARVHTLSVVTANPDILDYAVIAQVPDVHRYFIRPKYGPILELDRTRAIIELDQMTNIIELTKSEEETEC